MKKTTIYIVCIVFLTSCFGKKKEELKPKKEEFKAKNITIYTTTENTNLKISLTDKKVFTDMKQPLETEIAILVNPKKQFQSFLGIGGAITDASAEVFAKLPKNKQEELLTAYYGNTGNNYNIMRTSIHSCDFSSESHTYVDDNDPKLKSFSIRRDLRHRIPMIKKAQKIIGEDLIFYASPWSPPAFMKSNKNMLQGGKLLKEYYQPWADYFVKFIQEYEKEGIPIWGVTIQNEPMAKQRWESCIYTAEEEKDFLKNYLGPTFEKVGFQDKNIVVWDHNRDLISHRARTIFDDPEASKYAWGIGFHWYETWTGGEPKYDNLKNIKESYPDKNLLFTEGCQESFDENHYNRWSNAERYGSSMINDFNSGTVGWTDWNILLDQTGGPNHVNNLCFAPIHADLRTKELIYTPSYYYIGHFSKSVKPNAKRISTTCTRSTLESTSFQNLDGKITTVIMNKTDSKINYKLIVNNREVSLSIASHAIQTLIY